METWNNLREFSTIVHRDVGKNILFRRRLGTKQFNPKVKNERLEYKSPSLDFSLGLRIEDLFQIQLSQMRCFAKVCFRRLLLRQDLCKKVVDSQRRVLFVEKNL